METARFGKAKISAFGSVRSAATYLAELSIIAASYIGLTESALLLPAINPAATLLWPPTGLALALVLLRGYRDLAGDFSGVRFSLPHGRPIALRVWLRRDRYSPC